MKPILRGIVYGGLFYIVGYAILAVTLAEMAEANAHKPAANTFAGAAVGLLAARQLRPFVAGGAIVLGLIATWLQWRSAQPQSQSMPPSKVPQ